MLEDLLGVAEDALQILMTLMRDGTVAKQLGKFGSQLRSPVRGWQRAGCNPATAARPSPAVASHGRFGVRPSHLDCRFWAPTLALALPPPGRLFTPLGEGEPEGLEQQESVGGEAGHSLLTAYLPY